MKKTLYSLMLNDEVVREVDALAHSLGTNRSNLINQILAEYVNYTTPERRINDVLSAISEMMAPSRELVPFFAPNSFSMSLKSSLEYKYRPTVKYEVELYRGGGAHIGIVRGLDLLGVETAGEIVLHQLVEELDILRDRPGELLGRTVALRHAQAADELSVIERIMDLHARRRGKVQILDPLPETEKLGHRGDQRRGLGTEDDR